MNISFALFVIFTAFATKPKTRGSVVLEPTTAPKTKTRGQVVSEPSTAVCDSQPKDQARNYLWHGLWTRAGNKPKAPHEIAKHWATLKDQRMIQHSFSVIGDKHFEPLADYGLLFDPLKLNDQGEYSAEIIASCSEDMHYPVDGTAAKKFDKHIEILMGKKPYPAVAPDYCDAKYITESDLKTLRKNGRPIKEVVDFRDTNPTEEKDSRAMILQHILEMSQTNRHNETIANIDIKDALGIGYKTPEGKQKAEQLQKALLNEKVGISLECIDLTKLQPSTSKSPKRKK